MVGLRFIYQKYIPQLKTPRIRSYFPFLAYSYIYNYSGGTKLLGKTYWISHYGTQGVPLGSKQQGIAVKRLEFSIKLVYLL